MPSTVILGLLIPFCNFIHNIIDFCGCLEDQLDPLTCIIRNKYFDFGAAILFENEFPGVLFPRVRQFFCPARGFMPF